MCSIFQSMESKSFENIIQKTLISGGLGGWFGAIYGANIAAIDPHRPRNPFQTALYISQKGMRCGAVGALAFGSAALVFKSFEH